MKAILDAIAYILTRDNSEDTLTNYKDIMNGKREIPVSSCPDSVCDYFESTRKTPDESEEQERRFMHLLDRLDERAAPYEPKHKPRERSGTRSEMIEAMKQKHPDCTVQFCYVDTENCFTHDGEWYCIHDSTAEYAPKETKHGLLYDADQVLVLRAPAGDLHFYTQSIVEIPDAYIIRI